jgi:hypothetical protein
VFLYKGSSKTPSKKWGKSMSKTFCPKKWEKTNRFSLQFYFIAFAVSLHEELKNTINIFSKTRPEILKNLKKVGRS